MSSGPPERADRVAALLAETARVSALSILFSEAVAERAGLNATDLESLDFLRRQGPLSAGQLAEMTGLSTGGAITALIDRLERLGYVQRERDVHDRRRVLVRALDDRAERELMPLYQPLERAMRELAARYDDEELALLLDFTMRASEVMKAQIARVRDDATPQARTPGEDDHDG
jgi:DNA-binding MarR family transcriptional regulator